MSRIFIVNSHVNIASLLDCLIGYNVSISPNVTILTAYHDPSGIYFTLRKKQVNIEYYGVSNASYHTSRRDNSPRRASLVRV